MSFELDPTFAQDPAKHFDTLQIHAGLTPDPTTGSAALPIYATAAWQFDDAEDAAAKFALACPGGSQRDHRPDPGSPDGCRLCRG